MNTFVSGSIVSVFSILIFYIFIFCYHNVSITKKKNSNKRLLEKKYSIYKHIPYRGKIFYIPHENNFFSMKKLIKIENKKITNYTTEEIYKKLVEKQHYSQTLKNFMILWDDPDFLYKKYKNRKFKELNIKMNQLLKKKKKIKNQYDMYCDEYTKLLHLHKNSFKYLKKQKRIIDHILNGSIEQFLVEKDLEEQKNCIENSMQILKDKYVLLHQIKYDLLAIHQEQNFLQIIRREAKILEKKRKENSPKKKRVLTGSL